MLRQQKIPDEATSAATSNNDSNDVEIVKQKLTQTYSNSSEKSDSTTAAPIIQHKIKSTLVQLDFVKSSLAINPCMVCVFKTMFSK